MSTPIVRVIDPRNYVFGRAVDILAYAVLGGMTHWAGPILGAILLSTLPETLRFLRAQREVINGLVIMLAIIYLPRGLADPHFWRRLRFWSRVPAAAQEAEISSASQSETIDDELAEPVSTTIPGHA